MVNLKKLLWICLNRVYHSQLNCHLDKKNTLGQYIVNCTQRSTIPDTSCFWSGWATSVAPNTVRHLVRLHRSNNKHLKYLFVTNMVSHFLYGLSRYNNKHSKPSCVRLDRYYNKHGQPSYERLQRSNSLFKKFEQIKIYIIIKTHNSYKLRQTSCTAWQLVLNIQFGDWMQFKV